MSPLNKRKTDYIIPLAYMIGDMIALISAFVLAFVLRVTYSSRPPYYLIRFNSYLAIILSLIPVFIAIFYFSGLYKKEIIRKRFKETLLLIMASFGGVMVLISVDYFMPNQTLFPAKLVPVYSAFGAIVLLIITRTALRFSFKTLWRFNIGAERIAIIGSNQATKNLSLALSDTKTSGYKIVALATLKRFKPNIEIENYYSTPQSLLKDIASLRLDSIIQTESFDSTKLNDDIRRATDRNHINFKYLPTDDNLTGANSQIELINDYPVLTINPTPLRGWGRIVKRLMDTSLAFISIIIFSPLMLIIAILIKIFDSGPVLFKNTRVTRYGNTFKAFKFRTMKQKFCTDDQKKVKKILEQMGYPELADKFNSGEKLDFDPRISKIGNFLRKTSLDELPQLFNIIMGQMSFVGPRAIVKDELKFYGGRDYIMLSVKTGLTGLAQVMGRSDINYYERARLDIYYVQNWNLWMDISILVRTIKKIFKSSDSR
jgi:exopolysaccharide biosynthesis polyprenyl glycosylphosphotransferase